MTSRLDILGVQAFVAIAELGSFRAAANHLHLSESALGRRLKKLEEGLEVQLFARTTRSVTISTEGIDFLPQARRVVEDLAAALNGLRAGRGSLTGTVKIGCLPTVAALKMPSLLRVYARDFPDVRVQLVDRSGTEIREAVLSGEVDFAITAAGPEHAKLHSEALFSEPMMAVCPSDHPLAARRRIYWADLATEPLINIGILSANRALIEASLREHSLEMSWSYQVENLSTAVSLVSAGAGIAILPQAAVLNRMDHSIRVQPLHRPSIQRHIVLLRRQLPMSTAASRLAELSREHLQSK